MAITVTWDSAFKNSPPGSQDPRYGDDRMRETRLAIEERFVLEHKIGGGDTNSKHGWHREGSAISYYETSAPTNRPDGATALDTDDTGRLWFDSDDGLFYVWNGSSWVSVLKTWVRCSIQGPLSIDSDVAPDIIFPRAAEITKVSVRLKTAPTGSSFIIDINKNGSDSIFSGATRPTIAAASNSDSVTSFHAANSVLTADEYLTLDIDQVGSSTAGADLSVVIEARLG